MTDNKILCSADEYAWLEDGLRSAKRAYEYATTKAKPGTAVAESAPKHLALINLYKSAMEIFAIQPDSVRSENGEMILSRKFGDEFGKLPGAVLNLVPVIVDEDKIF